MAHMGGPNGMTNGGMTQVANVEVERHIRQNNERLRCIQRHLQTPDGFEKAAKELLEWCSDQRAFQKAFEPSLMSCLTVISEVATKPGFNLNLGYQLLARCSSHRDKFSPKSSNMLRFWSEDLGNKLLILQHQKRSNENMKPNPSSGAHMGMGYNPMAPRMGYPDSPVWNTGNGPNQVPLGPGSMNQRQQHHSVSVTTTVWGVTNTTQTPPIRGQSHPPINQYQMGPGSAPHSRIQSQNPGYHINNYNHQKPGPYGGPGPYQRPGYGEPIGGTHRGMPGPGYAPNNGPHQGHHMGPDTGDYPPPAAAAAAAAVAAAAATATATATAMVVNDQQHQQQQQNDMYEQMGPHRGNNMHPMDPSGNNMTSGPMMRDPSGPMVSAGGRGPMRPNMMGQYVQQGKPMGPPGPHPMNPNHHPVNSPLGGPSHGPGYNSVNAQYRPAFRQNSNSYGPQSPYDAMPPNQFKSPPPSSFSPRIPSQSPHQGPLLTATPDFYAGAPSPYYPNSQPTPNSAGPIPTPGPMGPTPRPSFNSQFSSMYRGPPQQHPSSSPMPGAPTPPITPGSAHNVPPYPGVDVKPSIHQLDVKPIIPNPVGLPPLEEPTHNPAMGNSNNDEMRMTFPVRDGIVLESFRLEHNRSVSTHAFYLRPPAYETLRMRVDLELQFKCYHHDDSMQYTNWPHSVQVTVNNTKMEIPRHPVPKPLYLRRVCRPGRNTIEITVSTCCCSHLFVLQLVHRPSVRSVLMGLLQKRMLPAYHCVTKINRYFNTGIISGTKAIGNGSNPNDDTPSTVVSLRCPITHKRINLPARGNECKHIQCFDLEAYLQLNSDKRTWKCPICSKSALLEGLEVDQYVWGILKESHPDDMEVIIDSKCHWKSVTVKREVILDEEGPPSKRFRSNGMSLSTMFNHLPSPGSYVPQITPLPHTRLTLTPDMQPSGMGFPQSSGGCGFQNNDNVPTGPSPGMSRNMGPVTNGMCSGMGPSSTLSPNNNMGMRNNMNNPGTLHRANPLHLENIAADDMVTIEKRLNHAMANNNNMATNHSTSSPNRPMSNQQQTLNPMARSSSNSHLPQSSGTFPSPRGSTADNRMRNTMSAPSNPNPSTPGNPATPTLDLLPLPSGSSAGNSGRGADSINSVPNVTSNSFVSSDVNFDADAAINGTVLADGEENIPTLDLPQLLSGDDGTLNGLFDCLGADPGEPNEEDLFSLFDT